MTGEDYGGGGAESPNGTTTSAATADVAAAPATETPPLNAIALAKEVVLERLENLLEWLLRRLKRYRAKRGDWWEK